MTRLGSGALAASALFVGLLFGLTTSACEDDAASGSPGPSGVDASFEASSADATRPQGEDASSSADAAPDGDAATPAFSPKSACDAPAPIATYAGSELGTRPVLASAPGSPIVAVWEHLLGGSPNLVEAKVYAAGAWGAVATLSTALKLGGTTLAAAGGGSAIVAVHENDDVGIRKRTTSGAFVDVGASHVELLNQYEKALRMGPGGHAVEVWRGDGTVGAALIDPAGANVTLLPEDVSPGALARVSAVIDAAGDGFVLWHDASTNEVVGRAFRAGAWKGAAAKLAVGGTASGLDAAVLPNGDAYVVWSRIDGSPGVHGATIHLDVATSTSSWSAVDDLLAGAGSAAHRVLAAADGELTALWGQNDGSGSAKLTARRKIAGGAWSAPVTLGKTTELYGAAIDASGHVTAAAWDGSGSAFHYRIAKGAATWSPAVRVDAKSGAGAVGGNVALAIDPANGDPIVAWASGKDILFTVCR